MQAHCLLDGEAQAFIILWAAYVMQSTSPFLNQHNMQIEISCKITFRQIQSRNRCLKNTNAELIKYFIIKYFIHFKNVICENTEIPPQENQNI